jgi:hypothetical protein
MTEKDNSLDEFVLFWAKIAEELKLKELSEDGSNKMLSEFTIKRIFLLGLPSSAKNYTWPDISKINLVESKLKASLAIATSNYRSHHPTILERIINSIRIRVSV